MVVVADFRSDDGVRRDRPATAPGGRGGYLWVVATGALSVVEQLLSGAIAGAVSKTVIAPGDRVKIIYQVDSSRTFSASNALQTARKIVQHGGVGSLWCGNGATMMRVVPYASVTFMSFDHYHAGTVWALQQATGDSQRSGGIFSRFIAGSLAGVTATTLTYPLDLLRARYAAHNDPLHPRYPSYLQGIREIAAVEGPGALYGGLKPTLIGIVPYAGFNFAIFGTLKARLVHLQHLQSDRELPTWQRLVAGGFSGLVAQSLTYPLDIVRRRMQVSPHKYRPLGMWGSLTHIYRHEGLRQGLLKGLAMNWIKGPVATAVTFTVSDLVKGRIKEYNRAVAATGADNAAKCMNHSLDAADVVTLGERCVCGGLAGGLAKLWTAPLDRIKIMYNVGMQTVDEHSSSHRHVFRQVREMLRETPHMWQGSGAMMVRVVPYAAVTYGAYTPLRAAAQRVTYSTEPSFASNFLAGATAASIATALMHPIDLLRVRSAASYGPKYLSMGSGLRVILQAGGMRSLYNGLGAALVGIAPMAGLSFATFEALRGRYCYAPAGDDSANNSIAMSFGCLVLCGAAAGIVAQAATYPLNIVRRRAMVDELVYSGIIHSLRDLYSSAGFYAGLYKRLPLAWVMGTATVGLSFAINDRLLCAVVLAREQVARGVVQLPSLEEWRPQPLWVADPEDSATRVDISLRSVASITAHSSSHRDR